jgi:alpha-tubulin suppressor-like RCC1 family protein
VHHPGWVFDLDIMAFRRPGAPLAALALALLLSSHRLAAFAASSLVSWDFSVDPSIPAVAHLRSGSVLRGAGWRDSSAVRGLRPLNISATWVVDELRITLDLPHPTLPADGHPSILPLSNTPTAVPTGAVWVTLEFTAPGGASLPAPNSSTLARLAAVQGTALVPPSAVGGGTLRHVRDALALAARTPSAAVAAPTGATWLPPADGWCGPNAPRRPVVGGIASGSLAASASGAMGCPIDVRNGSSGYWALPIGHAHLAVLVLLPGISGGASNSNVSIASEPRVGGVWAWAPLARAPSSTLASDAASAAAASNYGSTPLSWPLSGWASWRIGASPSRPAFSSRNVTSERANRIRQAGISIPLGRASWPRYLRAYAWPKPYSQPSSAVVRAWAETNGPSQPQLLSSSCTSVALTRAQSSRVTSRPALSACGVSLPQLGEWLRSSPAMLRHAASGEVFGRGALAAHTAEEHSAAVTEDGLARTFGEDGGLGRLGLPGVSATGHVPSLTPDLAGGPVSLNAPAIDVSVGIDHSLFLLETGRLEVAGDNIYGALGVPDEFVTNPAAYGPVTLSSTETRALAIAATLHHTVVLLSDGTIRAFGLGASGQLGYGNTNDLGWDSGNGPATNGAVPVGGSVSYIAAGDSHTLVVLDNGIAKAFGSNANGRLGLGSSIAMAGDTPGTQGGVEVAVCPGEKVVAVAAGLAHSLFLLSNGQIAVAGSNAYGQLGIGSTTSMGASASTSPCLAPRVAIGGPYRAVAIAANGYHSAAILEDGSARVWGRGTEGQLSTGGTQNLGITWATLPIRVGPALTGGEVSLVRAGPLTTMFVTQDGSLRAVGSGLKGKLGLGSVATSISAAEDSAVVKLSPRLSSEQTDADKACIVQAYLLRASPPLSRVDLPGSAVAIAASQAITVVALGDDVVYAFGDNTGGKLSVNGSSTSVIGDSPSSSPSRLGKVVTPSAIRQFSAGSSHCVWLTADAKVYTSGSGNGLGRTSPVGNLPLTSIPEISLPSVTAKAVSAGALFTMIVASDGSLFSFGLSSDYGHCQPTFSVDTVTKVTNPGGYVVDVSSGARHSLLLFADGTVRACGENLSGQLGYGTGTAVSNPGAAGTILLSTTRKAVAVAAGDAFSMVLMDNGELYAFGDNTYGQLGLGRSETSLGKTAGTIPRLLGPVDLGGPAIAIAAGGQHAVVLMADMTVRAYGRGESGQLGRGTAVNLGGASETVPSKLGPIPLGERAVGIAAGSAHTVILTESGSIVTFGSNSAGQLGQLGPTASATWQTSAALKLSQQSSKFLRPARCSSSPSLVTANALAETSSPRTIISPSMLSTAPGVHAAPWSISIASMQGLSAWPAEQLVAAVDIFDGRWQSTSDDAAAVTSLSGFSSTALRADICPTGLYQQERITGSFVCSTSSAFDWSAPAAIAPRDLTATLSGRSRLLPAGSSGGSPTLVIRGPLGWAHVLESIRDDSLDQASSGIVPSENITSLAPTLQVWLDGGGGSTGTPAWSRRVRGCSFSSAAEIKCTTLPPGSGPVGSVSVRVELGSAPLVGSLVVPSVIGFESPSMGPIIPSAGLPTIGSQSIIVQGRYFGDGDAAAPTVQFIGIGPCTGVLRVSDSELHCNAPAGAGANIQVVATTSSQVSATSGSVSYASPLVTVVSPSSALAGAVGAKFRVNGTNLAVLPSQLTSATIGGVSCSSLELVEAGVSFDCLLSPVPGSGWPDPRVVVASVGGQSSGSVRGLFDGIGGPVIQAVSVAKLSVTASPRIWEVTLSGTGFGSSAADVLNVMEQPAGRQVASWSHPSGSDGLQLLVRLPGDFAPASTLVVVNRWGVASAPSASVLFDRPTVTAVDPSSLLVGVSNSSVQIDGANLGRVVADFDTVKVGGVACQSVQVLTPQTSILCTGLSSPPTGWPAPREISLSVAGQSTGRVLGLFQGVGKPEVQSVSIARLLGGGSSREWTVEVSGNNLGDAGLEVHLQGSSVVLDHTVVGTDGTRLLVRVPSTTPEGALLYVTNPFGVSSGVSSTNSITFQRPVLNSVSPAYVLAGSQGITVELSGAGLGNDPSDIDWIKVGGVTCGNVTIVSQGTRVACANFSAPDPTWPLSTTVQVSIAGHASSPTRGVFEGIGAPSITAAAAGSFPTSGNSTVRIVGDGFGRQATDVQGVLVIDVETGFAQLVPSDWRDSLTMQMALPPGAGEATLRVLTRTGVMSQGFSIRYDGPTVSDVTPRNLLPGRVIPSIEVCGTNFPPAGLQSKLDWVKVGGLTCATASLHPTRATCVICENLNATSGFVHDREDSAQVSVAGVASSLARGLVNGAPLPVLSSAEPRVIRQRETITVLGRGLGFDGSDLMSGTVYAFPPQGGSAPCEKLTWVSDSAVQCEVPASLAIWTLPSDVVEALQPEVPYLSVDICTRTGACTGRGPRVEAGGLISGALPRIQPWQVSARRPIGDPFTLEIQWMFVAEPDEESADFELNTSGKPADATTTFSIEILSSSEVVSSGGLNASAVHDDEVWARAVAKGLMNSVSVERARARIVSESTAPTTTAASQSAGIASDELLNKYRWELLRSSVTVRFAEPVFIRVRAVHAGGASKVSSAPSSFVPSNCESSQYLETTGSLNSWKCQSCPTDRAVCAGLTSANVTARPGWWRVPWASGGFGFARCDPEAACVGVDPESIARESTGTNVSARLLSLSPRRLQSTSSSTRTTLLSEAAEFQPRVVLPGVELDPASMEGCAAGRKGVLCSSCASGWHRDVGAGCTACGDGNAQALALFLGVGAAAFIVVAFLVQRGVAMAERSASELGDGGGEESPRSARGDDSPIKPQSNPLVSASEFARGPAARKAKKASPGEIRPSVSDGEPKRRQSRFSFALLLGTGGRPKKKKSPKASVVTMVLKILFNHIQLLSILSDIRLAWPPAILTVFEAGKVTSSFSTAGLGLECILGSDAATAVGRTVAIVVSSPALMLWGGIVLGVPMLVSACFKKSSRPTCSLWFERFMIAVILLGFLTHSTVTKAAFAILTCRRLFPEGQPEDVRWVLAQDPDVDCGDTRVTISRMAVALPSLMCMTIGLPAMALWGLACPNLCSRDPKHRVKIRETCSRTCNTAQKAVGCGELDSAAKPKDATEAENTNPHLSEPQTVRRWGFLFQGFRRTGVAHIWEVVNMARKTMIAGATVVLAPAGTLQQGMVALCVGVLFLVAHTTIQPYELQALNRLETLALTAACITLAGVPILVSAPWDSMSPPTAAIATTIVIVGVNLAVAVSAVAVVSIDTLRRAVKRTRKNILHTTGLTTASHGSGRFSVVRAPLKSASSGVNLMAIEAPLETDEMDVPGPGTSEQKECTD